jgi:hypothetical protein
MHPKVDAARRNAQKRAQKPLPFFAFEWFVAPGPTSNARAHKTLPPERPLRPAQKTQPSTRRCESHKNRYQKPRRRPRIWLRLRQSDAVHTNRYRQRQRSHTKRCRLRSSRVLCRADSDAYPVRLLSKSPLRTAIHALRTEKFASVSVADVREIFREVSDAVLGWFVYLNKENPQTH